MQKKYLKKENLVESILRAWFAYKGRRESWSQEYLWEQKERIKDAGLSWRTATEHGQERTGNKADWNKWPKHEDQVLRVPKAKRKRTGPKEEMTRGPNIKEIKENGYPNGVPSSKKYKVTVNIYLAGVG